MLYEYLRRKLISIAIFTSEEVIFIGIFIKKWSLSESFELRINRTVKWCRVICGQWKICNSNFLSAETKEMNILSICSSVEGKRRTPVSSPPIIFFIALNRYLRCIDDSHRLHKRRRKNRRCEKHNAKPSNFHTGSLLMLIYSVLVCLGRASILSYLKNNYFDTSLL